MHFCGLVSRLAQVGAVVCLFSAPAAAQCSFSLTPNTASFTSAGGNGLVTIAASASTCSRTASSSVPWITISFGSPGTGNGTVGYTVQRNLTPTQRSGTLTIAGQTFSVTQSGAQCDYNITPALVIAEPAGASGSVEVRSNCSWTATPKDSWISIVSGGSGEGNGTVSWAASANKSGSQRTGAITIGSQTFTINQASLNCTLSLTSNGTTLPQAGGGGTLAFMTDCSWTASSTATWITITSPASGSGSGQVTFNVAANTTNNARTGTITLNNQVFTITQLPVCTFTLSPSTASYTSAGGSGAITTTANNSACERTAVADAAWLSITTGATGAGSGTVNYTVQSNTGTDGRQGHITIGGATFVVVQLGGGCAYAVSPSSVTAPVGSSSGTLSLTTACSWTAVSDAPWLQAAPTSGTGNAILTYTVLGNSTGQPRTGSIQIGTTSFTVFQPASACEVTLQPESATFEPSGGTGSVFVTSQEGCTWTAARNAPWITLTSSTTASGEATLTFSVAPNGTSQTRTADIAIGNKLFRVTQTANACSLSLPLTSLDVAAAGGSFSFAVNSTCPWASASTVPWISIGGGGSGTGNGLVSFSVASNPSTSARSGSITVNGQTFLVTQSGTTACSVSVSPAQLTIASRGGTALLQVSGTSTCAWTPTTDQSWLTLSWSSVSGTGHVMLQAAANRTGAARSATIRVLDKSAIVTQEPAGIHVTAAGVLNAASYEGGAVAPGTLVTIFGEGFGPATLAALELDTTGRRVKSDLASTRVLFDGVAAPMIYAVDGQVSVVTPFSIGGRESTSMQAEYQGQASEAVTLRVVPTQPAIFTQSRAGTGPAVVLNQNNMLNTSDNPAARNSIVQIYATGGGLLQPAVQDGAIAMPPLARPVVPVRVRIGGRDAEVTYAGVAPGLVTGVMQINVRIPALAAASDAVPITVQIGDAESAAGVTLSVR